jgi:hypothetical protein
MELISTELQKQNLSGNRGVEWHIPLNTKRTLIYSGAFIFVTALLVYFFSISFTKGIPSVADRYILTLFFLSAGIAHYFYFPKLLPHLYDAGSLRGLVYSFILAVLLSDFILLVFFITGVQGNELAVAAGCAFVLPDAVNKCRLYYRHIEAKEYKNWVIPPGTEPDKRKSLLLNSIFFRIKMKVNYSDISDTVFTVNLPLHLTLSTAFCRFLYDQHNVVEVKDDQQQPYAWRFSVKGWFGKKVLDPESSLHKNGIKQCDVILIERIKL